MQGDTVNAEGPGDVGSAPEESCLWTAWRERGDLSARASLVNLHLGFARIMAGKFFARRRTDEIEFEEYLQLAAVGLIESVDRFEPERGASFRTYAGHRIQGAIVSGLEALTERARQLALKRRVEQERLQSLAKDAQPQPPDPFVHLASIAVGLALGFMLDDVALYRADDASCSDQTYATAEFQQMRLRLVQLVDRLPEREAKIVRHHYFQQIPFDEIAASLGITKGRVSQLHKRALTTLRQALNGSGAVSLDL